MPSSRVTPLTRSANACDACRSRKVKCSGSRPCVACTRRGLECEFGFVGRRGYSEAYVQKLLDKIKEHEEASERGTTVPKMHGSSHHDEKSESGESSPQKYSIHEEHEQGDSPAGQRGQSPMTELDAAPAFESRVRSIIREHAGSRVSPSTMNVGTEQLDVADNTQWRGAADMVYGIASPALLSKDESFRLFDVFVSWMGTHQHYLDTRSFADNVDLLYASDATRNERMLNIWFTQYLLVMAIGMLIDCPQSLSDIPHGQQYFAEAARRLPPTYEMGYHGIISVEILALACLYLRWCDRKHDAYLYSGSAVRVALALGCALPFREQHGVSSERCHRTRVWWTVYVQDRCLATTLGMPAGTDERQLRADLPKPTRGFEDPLPLIISVQITRAKGDTITSFYGNATISQTKLVQKIQSTLQGLYEAEKSIPPQYTIDFSSPRLRLTRTSASLYLSLFQAIILCIRPIIFQRVKDRINSSRNNRPALAKSTMMTRLCHSCREAAKKSIRILSAMREDPSVAPFGYFDLDVAFSAAFLIVMKGFLDTNDFNKPPDSLGPAASVLQHLASTGNKTAQRRLDELKQFCSNVWSPDKLSAEWGWLKDASFSASNSVSAQTPSLMLESSRGDGSTPITNASQTTPALDALEPWGNWQVSTEGSFDFGGDMDLSMDMGNIYSCFNDPNLPLTGIDEVDWQEVSKMFSLTEA